MSKIRLHGTSSGYVEIAPAAAASNNTLTAPSTIGEIIAKDAAGAIGITSMKASNVNVGAAVTITESGIEASGIGITCANINGTQIGGRRNLIINGAMNVAQRGTSHTPSNSTSTYQLDRFIMQNSNSGAYTVSQSSTAPDNRFRNSLKLDVTTADTALTANQYCQFQQRIEAQNLQAVQNFRQPITVSFWVRSNKTGNYSITLQQSDNSNRQMAGQYTISAADTWEKKIITVPADSSGLVNNDNGMGLILTWGLAYGSTYNSGSLSTNNAFKAYASADFGAGQEVNILDSTSNEWYLTGVQVEVGTQATDFEHLSFGEELALCQRYYQVISSPTTSTLGFYGNDGRFYSAGKSFHTQMRTTPSTSTYQYDGAGTNYWVEPGIQAFSANSTTGITVVSNDNSFYFYQARQAGNSNPTRITTYVWEPAWSGIFEAEL
tara:strand:- start:237 stop:1544 length:1308 start_codon:yes stop_codon:yes gene_type:complete